MTLLSTRRDAAVKANQAPTSPANGSLSAAAVGTGQSDGARAGTKRKAEDLADVEQAGAGSTEADGGAKDKKPKPSPSQQSPLDKAAAAKGQRTMSCFFNKK